MLIKYYTYVLQILLYQNIYLLLGQSIHEY